MIDLCHSERAADPDPPNSYLRVEWRHQGPDPALIYSELDEQRGEVRKVEMFRDSRVTHAWGKGSTGTTQLGDQPAPSSCRPRDELLVTEISRADFEAVWDAALESEDP